jgi:hypothetical protein
MKGAKKQKKICGDSLAFYNCGVAVNPKTRREVNLKSVALTLRTTMLLLMITSCAEDGTISTRGKGAPSEEEQLERWSGRHWEETGTLTWWLGLWGPFLAM